MRRILSVLTLFVVFTGFLALPSLGLAQEKAGREVEILSLEGTASIKRADQNKWVSASKGDILGPGDMLRTDPMSSVKLNFDGSGQTAVVQVSENAELTFSTLTLDRTSNAKETILDLAIGSVLIKASKLEAESKFEVSTPTSVVGVRGTTFEVRVSAAE